MSGIAAGVVTAAEVNGLPQQPGGLALSLQSPGTWAYVWIGAAFLYLIGIYLGMIQISRRG